MGWQFCGQPLSEDTLELIVEVTGSCTGVSRTELAATLCELLEWRRANGRLKSRECWALVSFRQPCVFRQAGERRLHIRSNLTPS